MRALTHPRTDSKGEPANTALALLFLCSADDPWVSRPRPGFNSNPFTQAGYSPSAFFSGLLKAHMAKPVATPMMVMKMKNRSS